MKVCVAEKPSVAREIAGALGATKRMNGFIEGNGYQLWRRWSRRRTHPAPGNAKGRLQMPGLSPLDIVSHGRSHTRRISKAESGPHQLVLKETWTQPPKPYTAATLLRAMETAWKLVDNDELRDALKENGIGRPSTRAAIIETSQKR
jgi:DNA topoisomerase IA